MPHCLGEFAAGGQSERCRSTPRICACSYDDHGKARRGGGLFLRAVPCPLANRVWRLLDRGLCLSQNKEAPEVRGNFTPGQPISLLLPLLLPGFSTPCHFALGSTFDVGFVWDGFPDFGNGSPFVVFLGLFVFFSPLDAVVHTGRNNKRGHALHNIVAKAASSFLPQARPPQLCFFTLYQNPLPFQCQAVASSFLPCGSCLSTPSKRIASSPLLPFLLLLLLFFSPTWIQQVLAGYRKV